MCTVCDPSVFSPDYVVSVAREQLAICRHEITLGARKLRANPRPELAECHLMADAILEYVGLELAIEREGAS